MSQRETCDASAITPSFTGGTSMLGPCILRHLHDGPVHKDANGTLWADTQAADSPANGKSQPDAERIAHLRKYLELTADSCHVSHRGVARDALRLLDGDDAATGDGRGLGA